MLFTRKAINLFFLLASIIKGEIVVGQTLQEVTTKGNTTTNPITLGPISTSDLIPVVDVLHNGASTFGTALQIRTTAGLDGPRLAFETFNGTTSTINNIKRWNLGIRYNSPAFGIFEDGYVRGFGTERFTLLPGGNVGIGTLSPPNKLTVAAGEGDGITIGSPDDPMGFDGGRYAIKFYGYRDIVPNAIAAKITAERTFECCNWKSQGSDLAFYTSGTLNAANADNSLERLRIKNNGNVGLGTSYPEGKLHIAGQFSGGIHQDGADRPGVGISGIYPQVVLMSGNSGNTNHGSTVMLGSYDAGASGAHRHWSIGTAGQGSTFLDIGYNENDLNPHAGIRNFNGSTIMTLLNNGKVGIGTLNPQEKLSVKGTVLATKVKISPLTNTVDWPDYVFMSGYKLRALEDVEIYINKHKHLPDIPSASKVGKEGLDLAETQAALLKKIEELTLYVIDLHKKIEKLKAKK